MPCPGSVGSTVRCEQSARGGRAAITAMISPTPMGRGPGSWPLYVPSPGCGVPHLAPQSTLHSLTHALQLLLRQTAGAMCPRHGRQGGAGGRTAAGSEGTGARAQRGVGPAGQGHGVEPAGVFLCLSEAGLSGSGGPAAVACLGTAGQSLAAFLWGQWALARLIQFAVRRMEFRGDSLRSENRSKGWLS